MKIIETDRLRLRPLEAEDAEELFRIYSVPENVEFMGQGSGSVEELRDHLMSHIEQHPVDGPGLSALILKETGEIIGRAGLFFSQIDGVDEVELAYLIDRNHWRMGYTTEASMAIVRCGFDDLFLSRIVAVIHPLNAASIRVAEKCGFRYQHDLDDYKDFGNVRLYSAQKRGQ